MSDNDFNTYSFKGYKVEARIPASIKRPVLISDTFYGEISLSEKWKRIRFKQGNDPNGIPSGNGFYSEMEVLPLESALALGWSLIAQGVDSGIEVRIVEYNITVKTKMTGTGIVLGLNPIELNWVRPETIQDDEPLKNRRGINE